MDLSIVIVSFNTASLLDSCLDSIKKSLLHTTISYEVVVIDNASQDNTKEVLRRKDLPLRVIWNKNNVGFGTANNDGIRSARGDYVLLLNSDTQVQDNAIEKLFTFATEHKRAFIGGKLFNTDGSAQTSCGPFFSLNVIFVTLFLKGDSLHLTRWSPNRVQRVDWVSGACIISRKDNFLDGLLFDESIFMYMEEIDLFMRARKQGLDTYFYPDAHIRHLGTGSIGDQKDPVVNIYKGLMYIYKKHHSRRNTLIVRYMLRAKAVLALCIGILIGNKTLKERYAKALSVV